MTQSLSKVPSIAFITLGCAKNEVDTAHMQARLQEAGFMLEDDPEQADAVVVNTCSFIQSATEESIETIFEVAGLSNVVSGAPLIVAGCMPARYGDDLAHELTEARSFVPCSHEDDIVEIVSSVLDVDNSRLACDTDASVDVHKGSVSHEPVSAYVKISDGCDRFCAYCTIPYIRGRYHSFDYETIRAEVAKHVSAGVREIVLIAQDTGRWGTDFSEPKSLAWLVSTLAETFPDTWFRVMYIQPEGVTDDFIEAVASHPNICEYFDIPLQHVDADILHAMNRKGSLDEFRALISRIQTRMPFVTLRTTLIAGFPGETDEQFDDLCEFVEEGNFDYVGVFPYSREEGTRAFNLPNQIDEDEKRDRAQRLRDIADAVCSQRINRRIGRQMDVLIEGVEEDGQLFGRAMCQAPEVDGVVYVSRGTIGDIQRVTITDTLLYEMEGE